MTQDITEIKSVAALMEYVRAEDKKRTSNWIMLEFAFNPNSIGPYGVGAQWGVIIKRPTTYIIDYGVTIEEAAERLLDRVLHPEKYPVSEDDD